MSPTITLRSVYRTPILDFLAPRAYQTIFKTQYAAITTSSSPPSSEPKPKSLDSTSSTKRRRPLSREQQQFLDSAVRISSIRL